MHKSIFVLVLLSAFICLGIGEAADSITPHTLSDYLVESDISKLQFEKSIGWEMCGVITTDSQKSAFCLKRRSQDVTSISN